jgi:hypothetical protein
VSNRKNNNGITTRTCSLKSATPDSRQFAFATTERQ